MSKQTTHRECVNCKYFQRYYVLNSTLRFAPTGNGFCSNGKVSDSVCKRCLSKRVECDLWQPHELRRLKIGYGIENKLSEANDLLRDILNVLRDVE